jgi:putative transposase
MTFRSELIDELLKDYSSPEDLMGEGGIFKQLTKALVERCLSAELDHHLTAEKGLMSVAPRIAAMVRAKKRSKVSLAKPRSASPETVTGPLPPISLRRARLALRALMARFCRCMPEG